MGRRRFVVKAVSEAEISTGHFMSLSELGLHLLSVINIAFHQLRRTSKDRGEGPVGCSLRESHTHGPC